MKNKLKNNRNLKHALLGVGVGWVAIFLISTILGLDGYNFFYSKLAPLIDLDFWKSGAVNITFELVGMSVFLLLARKKRTFVDKLPYWIIIMGVIPALLSLVAVWLY